MRRFLILFFLIFFSLKAYQRPRASLSLPEQVKLCTLILGLALNKRSSAKLHNRCIELMILLREGLEQTVLRNSRSELDRINGEMIQILLKRMEEGIL